MYKLIVIFAALVPLILLMRTIFGSRSKKASRAFSEFKDPGTARKRTCHLRQTADSGPRPKRASYL